MTKIEFQLTEWEKKRNLKDTDQTDLRVKEQITDQVPIIYTPAGCLGVVRLL